MLVSQSRQKRREGTIWQRRFWEHLIRDDRDFRRHIDYIHTPAPATVEVSIDGQALVVPEGTSVMRAAALSGVDIPKLCATDRLDAFGSCRLCLVEIDGARARRRRAPLRWHRA